jgi:ribonucleoside-diphosphate reductase alpha chain
MSVMTDPFGTSLSRRIWEQRYRYRQDARRVDREIADTWQRVARAAASPEGNAAGHWEAKFHELLRDFRFLPGGRILAGAGTDLNATLLNCFVMGKIEDSVDGIFSALKEAALTMQQGGGIGCDFSTLRPAGERARATGNIATGPVSFMQIWDAACATITGSGPRGGAMMASLRCDHPDILQFIEAKRRSTALSRFNLSVQITDDFMRAEAQGEPWPLVFPSASLMPAADKLRIVQRSWARRETVDCAVLRTIGSRAVWDAILEASFECGDPGVLFVDTVNRENNLHYCERLSTTNPCGELPLPAYGACDLGSLNLTQFVRDPFSPHAHLDMAALRDEVTIAVRFLDNILDVSRYPLPAQRAQALQTRRVGLGITGLADSLVMIGLRYDSAAGRELATSTLECMRNAAYEASIELAKQKGVFPAFQVDGFMGSGFVRRLPTTIRDAIARHGIRNGQLLALAPAGSISLLAGNVSSGIEPVFAFEGMRRIRTDEGWECHRTTNYAWRQWRERCGTSPLGEAFVAAQDMDPEAHLAMQATLQPFVDGAISKTINLPRDYPFERHREIFATAYRLGLKGCTVFRPSLAREGVLSSSAEQAIVDAAECCLPT